MIVRTTESGPQVVATGYNRPITTNDPTAHAEIVAIRAACRKLGTFVLTDCDIYTSCEPCPMCLGAIYWARLRRLYYANTREEAAVAGFDSVGAQEEAATVRWNLAIALRLLGGAERQSAPLERAADLDTGVRFVGASVAGPDGPVYVPWRQLHDESRAVGAALQAHGLVPGDHVAVLGPSSRALITVIRGCWMAGCASMVLPLPMRMGSLEVFVESTRARIRHGDAKLLLIDDTLAAFYEPARGDPPAVPVRVAPCDRLAEENHRADRGDGNGNPEASDAELVVRVDGDDREEHPDLDERFLQLVPPVVPHVTS